MTYPIPSFSIHNWSTSYKQAGMPRQNEKHSKRFDPSYALQSQTGVLLRRKDLLHVVDNGKCFEDIVNNKCLVLAVVHGVNLENGAEE